MGRCKAPSLRNNEDDFCGGSSIKGSIARVGDEGCDVTLSFCSTLSLLTKSSSSMWSLTNCESFKTRDFFSLFSSISERLGLSIGLNKAPQRTQFNMIPASINIAPRHPNSSIRYFEKGLKMKAPSPLPHTARPVAKARFSSK